MDEQDEQAVTDAQFSVQPGSDRSEIYTGNCVGGPFNGNIEQSRYPKGFVLVDKPSNMAWIYDYEANDPEQTPGAFSVFRCREPGGRTLDTQKRVDAALEHDFDVRSL